MVLNPAIAADPLDPNTLFMLFRATGAWNQARLPGKASPYPIFLGFGISRDGGIRWDFDFSRPAFAPRLEYEQERFLATSIRDGKIFDYANGCIEDPRLFPFEGQLYLSVACRAFPPGPYWDYDDPTQCLPDWVTDQTELVGRAVTENRTVSLLYLVDLEALRARCYEAAFHLVTPLHQPEVSDNRDVVLFPRRLKIDGHPRIVCLHRPKEPWNYAVGHNLTAPSIFLAWADQLEDFFNGRAHHEVFAVPCFDWERNRIGSSWAPLELEPGLWLLPYHGKQDDIRGYTQSFMLLRERADDLPRITARPLERLLFADQDWEREGDFSIPCIFTCSGIRRPDGSLLMGYGAADRVVGLAEGNFEDLISFLLNREKKS